MKRIFQGDFAPGTRLPPERRLAADLGVDRTTLRMALKQLQRLRLVAIRHGSGIEVVDYREHGGLDALAALFALEDAKLDAGFLVEALDFWLESFSMTAAKAIARMSLEDFGQLEKMLDRSIASIGQWDDFVDAQVEIQDALAAMSGSVIFRMLSNSTRPLRRRIMRLLPETVDMTQSLVEMKQMLRMAAATRPDERSIRTALLEALKKQAAGFRSGLLLGHSASAAPRMYSDVLPPGGKRRPWPKSPTRSPHSAISRPTRKKSGRT
jgi:GntR family transcriptional repressor for pyruvate dehydrogenase complex